MRFVARNQAGHVAECTLKLTWLFYEGGMRLVLLAFRFLSLHLSDTDAREGVVLQEVDVSEHGQASDRRRASVSGKSSTRRDGEGVELLHAGR